MNEMTSDTAVPIIRVNKGTFERCRFSSNKATNHYWFHAVQGSLRIEETSFSDWSKENKIAGIFTSNLVYNVDYGTIVIDKVLYNSNMIKSPKDINHIWNNHYPIFDVRNGYGVSIVDGYYDTEKLGYGCKYTLFNKYTANPRPVIFERGFVRYIASSDNFFVKYTRMVGQEAITINKEELPSGVYQLSETAVGDYTALLYIDTFSKVHVLTDEHSIIADNFIEITNDDSGNFIVKYHRTGSTNLQFAKISV
jgi:hypothetical protein